MLPVLLTMTCNNGNYTSPSIGNLYDSLPEGLTQEEENGAVASWLPTGKGNASARCFLDQGFFDILFNDNDGLVKLGQSKHNGKYNLWGTGSHLDLLDTFLLFGDPAL